MREFQSPGGLFLTNAVKYIGNVVRTDGVVHHNGKQDTDVSGNGESPHLDVGTTPFFFRMGVNI